MELKDFVRGPITSRRLGKSINVINCPESVCTYSCIYCQGGQTLQLTYERTEFFNPMEIVKAVRLALAKAKESRESYDYIAFIPDGEPTQDINLGKEIEMLKPFGIKIGVMTNSSLIWREDVRADLMKADWVSLKLDAVDEDTWRATNRPHKSSRFGTIIEGIIEFGGKYEGELVTETMLVADHNDSDAHAKRLAAFLKNLKPSKAYLSVPTNPPTLDWVKPPDESKINRFYQLIRDKFTNLEYLVGYESAELSVLGNVEFDLLAMASVRPLGKSEVGEMLTKGDAKWALVKDLVAKEKLVEVRYGNDKYYLRKVKMAE